MNLYANASIQTVNRVLIPINKNLRFLYTLQKLLRNKETFSDKITFSGVAFPCKISLLAMLSSPLFIVVSGCLNIKPYVHK